jgi:hypothetical protein
MILRITLTIAAILAAVCYAFVAFVALVVSGTELVKQPLFYYAALAPFVYLGFCISSCWLPIDARTLRTVGIVAHVIAIPLLFYSLLGLGLLLPVFAVLWFFMIREKIRIQRTSQEAL